MEKGNDNKHNFDLSKPKKRSFDLTKDPDNESFPWKKIIGGLFLVGFLGIGGYGVFSLVNNKEKPIDPVNGKVDTVGAGEKKINEDDSLAKGQQNEDTANINDAAVSVPSESIEEIVISVIRGNYGNNPFRRRKLGDRYQEIQDRVNQMYRDGKVR